MCQLRLEVLGIINSSFNLWKSLSEICFRQSSLLSTKFGVLIRLSITKTPLWVYLSSYSNVEHLYVRVGVSGRMGTVSPPKCSWMSHPICSLSPRHKWTLNPLVRWLISAPLSLVSSPSRIHSVHAASSAIQRCIVCIHTPTLVRTRLSVKINEGDRCIIQHVNLQVWGGCFFSWECSCRAIMVPL